jgi:hypothetical protein
MLHGYDALDGWHGWRAYLVGARIPVPQHTHGKATMTVTCWFSVRSWMDECPSGPVPRMASPLGALTSR